VNASWGTAIPIGAVTIALSAIFWFGPWRVLNDPTCDNGGCISPVIALWTMGGIGSTVGLSMLISGGAIWANSSHRLGLSLAPLRGPTGLSSAIAGVGFAF
jgi:hypothetical protein